MRKLLVENGGVLAAVARALATNRMDLFRRLRELGMGNVAAQERERAAKRFRLLG